MSRRQVTEFLARTNTIFLKGALWEPDIEPLPSLRESVGDYLTPDMISVPEMVLRAGEIIAQSRGHRFGDLFQSVSASFNIPWLELLCGCRANIQDESIWAESSEVDYDTLACQVFDPGNPWFQKWLECQRALGRLAEGQFPVSLPVMHGPLDLLSAVKGPAQLCLDLLDRPVEVKRALAGVTDLWVAAAHQLLSVTPSFEGGMCSRMKIWLPGSSVTLQDDATSLLSPSSYTEFVQGCEEQIVHAFPYHTYHSHSTSAHLLELIAGMPGLTSIQITLDPNGPPKPKLRSVIRNVLRKKPVLLCVWDREWAEWCRQELDPGGACIAYIIRAEEDWKACEEWMQET